MTINKTIGAIILIFLTLGCVDVDHAPDVDVESKITNDELIVTLKADKNYDNLKLEVQSEKLSIAPLESEILSPIDINTGEELKYHFTISNSGYERGEKLNVNIYVADNDYESRNTKKFSTTYSPGQIPGFGIFIFLISLILSARLIKRKEMKH